MARLTDRYIGFWTKRGYSNDIPDEVPVVLMQEGLAPSYKAICIALLKNDMGLHSLGFVPSPSPWYGFLKRIELADRAHTGESRVKKKAEQMVLVDVAPVQKAPRRGPPDWPQWWVITRCLTCDFARTQAFQARDMAGAKKLAREALSALQKSTEHTHRWAQAAGGHQAGG